MNLNRRTWHFDNAYKRNKKAQESLKRSQTKMFDAFTAELEKTTLAQQTVTLPPDSPNFPQTEEGWTQWMKFSHPGWRLISWSPSGVAVIEEDPAFKKFTYINPETKRVYGRTYAEGSPMLDDERMRTEDPELWERISSWPEPWWSLVRGAIKSQLSLRWSDEALDDMTDDYLRTTGIQRVVKDPNTLNNEDLSQLQAYLSPGQLTVRLVTPRDAKPEELEEVNE